MRLVEISFLQLEVLIMAEKLTFAEKLATATNEDKQVNPIYVNAISANLPKLGGGMDAANPNYALYTDGIFDCYYLKDDGDKEWFLLQLECKLDVDLSVSADLAKVIVQVLYYMKQLEGKWSMPKVIVLGTKKNCMVIPAVLLDKKYVKPRTYSTHDEQGNKISASVAPNHHLYAPLLREIERDAELQSVTRIIEVTDKSAVKELCIDILKVAKDLGIKEEISAENLARAFDFFDMKVLTEKSRKNLSSRVKAEAFMQLMLNPERVQTDFTMDVLGNKIYSGTMNFNGTLIEVDNAKFNSFANVFAVRQYSVPDQKKITEITDRLIEDTDRRRKGDFYTPTIWVNEAHKLMDKNLGADWRQKCIVWDCAWGTGNLTRDYKFSDLYCSTLMEEDLKIGAKYNPFATKFQYDFLNDDVEDFESLEYLMWEPFRGTAFYKAESVKQYINLKDIAELYATAAANGVITEERAQVGYANVINRLRSTKLYSLAPKLIDSLMDTDNPKPLVFLINPPYATTGNIDMKGNKEAGLGNTAVNELMDGYGGCQQQLYAQFIYRISKIKQLFNKKVHLGLFCPTNMLTGKQFNKLRNEDAGSYINGFYFQASQFANVSSDWAIAFSLWGIGNKSDEESFILDVAELGDNGEIEIIQRSKTLYSIGNKGIQNMLKKTKIGSTFDTHTMSSGLTITDKAFKMPTDSLGYLFMDTPRVGYNTRFVTLIPRKMKGNKIAVSINKDNFDDCSVIYAVRKLISGKYSTWINNSDEYMEPDRNNEKYKQFEQDCIVYQLFHDVNNMTSLRGTDIDEDIYNEFFWLSRETMLSLASGENNPENTNNTVYNDCITHAKSERFVYEKLQTVSLSDDAKFVLDYATAILIETFKHREAFDKNHPEYHINSWDAGWYQIKALAKEYLPEQLKAFNEIYKKFEDRMRPLVYELGFLYE